MRVRLPGINSKRKRLADGSYRTYYYAWKGGPRLRGERGSVEFIASFHEAASRKVAVPTGVMLTLVHRFQESSEFLHKISKRTRDDYIKHFRSARVAFGPLGARLRSGPESRASHSMICVGRQWWPWLGPAALRPKFTPSPDTNRVTFKPS